MVPKRILRNFGERVDADDHGGFGDFVGVKSKHRRGAGEAIMPLFETIFAGREGIEIDGGVAVGDFISRGGRDEDTVDDFVEGVADDGGEAGMAEGVEGLVVAADGADVGDGAIVEAEIKRVELGGAVVDD